MSNSKAEVRISDFAELNALRKALLGIKFDKDPSVPEVPGSPYIAALANRIVSACEEHEVTSGRVNNTQAAEWRDISNHAGGALDRVKDRLRECSEWSEWNHERRSTYISCLLAPFRADDDTFKSLLEFTSSHHNCS